MCVCFFCFGLDNTICEAFQKWSLNESQQRRRQLGKSVITYYYFADFRETAYPVKIREQHPENPLKFTLGLKLVSERLSSNSVWLVKLHESMRTN